MQVVIQKYKPVFNGFFEYLGIWSLAGLVGGVSAPVFATGPTETFYAFVFQVIGGVVIGALISIAYTIFQNKYNQTRKLIISCGVAIGAWLLVRYLIVTFLLIPS